MPVRFPQTEVTVWLHGMGEPRDVTCRHSVACASPFTICIGFEVEDTRTKEETGKRVSLRFHEHTGQGALLGEMDLELSAVLPSSGPKLYLFEARECTNLCLPWHRLRMHTMFNAYVEWKNRGAHSVKVTSLDNRCNEVTFICPRPVGLVSVYDGVNGNIFPINLMGSVGKEFFVFALNSWKQTAPMVNELRELALSSIPFEQAAVVRELGRNHNRRSIEWERLPFGIRKSSALGIPVPEFALRVRELKVELVRPLGSHTFFAASVVGDEICGNGPEFGRIHGLYEAWRRNRPPVGLQNS